MRILYVEPWHGGSHAAFGDALVRGIAADWTRLELPARHWKWRMRGVAAWLALEHGATLRAGHDVLFASSFVPLAELVGLVPELARVPAILYFHENQLAYPHEGGARERDLHFGFTQLVSALAATRCAFNSAFNRDSFLAAARELLGRMPDAVPRGWVERIAERSVVLPVPLDLPDIAPPVHVVDAATRARGPLVVWNHRWEFDKDPATFLAVVRRLVDAGVPLRIAICGQRFARCPRELDEAPAWLGDRLVHFGAIEERGEYLALLGRADIVVSTAIHEFFGLAVLEAVHLGAMPLVPDRLAYPELVPAEHRWSDAEDLARRLRAASQRYVAGEELRADRRSITGPLLAGVVVSRYESLLRELC